MIINKAEILTKIIINVMLIVIFIGYFFVSFGPYFGKIVINHQMSFLCSNISNTFKFFGKNTSEFAIAQIKQTQLPDQIKEDYLAMENNKYLNNIVFYSSIIFCLSMISLIYFIKKMHPDSYDLSQIFSNNIIILIFVALTEFSFVNFFVSKYISIDPNKIKLTVLKNLKKHNYI